MRLIKTMMVALVCAVVLAMAAPAFAETSPAETAYGGEGGTQVVQTTESLPFTGINVGVIVGLGVVLLGAGIVVRRRVVTGND
jgi:hypothetical protein